MRKAWFCQGRTTLSALLRLIAISLLCLTAVLPPPLAQGEEGENMKEWHFGFGRRQILFPESEVQSLYIAGYHNGVHISETLDWCEARAVWLDDGGEGALIIGVDCVALDSGTVGTIRDALKDIPGCQSVNVFATHTHAGPDTLGLWGPVMQDGKNKAYMEALVRAACEAAGEAAAGTHPASLRFGLVKTENMYRDSRYPTVYDENLYQLRFAALDGAPGLRLLFYGAHAESLRGGNTRLSRDYPGLLCDGVAEATGDGAMFLPGAVGGLIMTREFVNASASPVENLKITAGKLVDYALSIAEESETAVSPGMKLCRQPFVVPLDNPVFLAYKALGILKNPSLPFQSATGFGVQTELTLLGLDGLTIAFLPGELFPELASGAAYGDANPEGVNPKPLNEIAAEHGLGRLLIVGLANDELGYIIPPSDFLLNEKTPYLSRTMDRRGEDHYEETNSVGPACAARLADAFAEAAGWLEE